MADEVASKQGVYGYFMSKVRALYDWVLHWADSPYGVWALAILAFAESSFFPIPPDVLLIALAVGIPKRSLRYALICSVASVIGGMFGYAIGHFLWYSGTEFSALAQFFFHYVPGFTPERFEYVAQLYNKWNFWVVFTAGFTPIPYKVITISAGVFKIDFGLFLLASAIGRSARFFLVGGLIYLFGEPIKTWIDKYFNTLVWVFTVLLIGGFILIKYVI